MWGFLLTYGAVVLGVCILFSILTAFNQAKYDRQRDLDNQRRISLAKAVADGTVDQRREYSSIPWRPFITADKVGHSHQQPLVGPVAMQSVLSEPPAVPSAAAVRQDRAWQQLSEELDQLSGRSKS